MSSKKKKDIVNVSSSRSTPTSTASLSRNGSSASSQKHARKSNQSASESVHSSTNEILSPDMEGGDNVLELVRVCRIDTLRLYMSLDADQWFLNI